MYCGGEWNKGPALIAGSSPLFHGTCQTTPKISILTRAAAVDKGMAGSCVVCEGCVQYMQYETDALEMHGDRPDIYDLQYILEVIMNYI